MRMCMCTCNMRMHMHMLMLHMHMHMCMPHVPAWGLYYYTRAHTLLTDASHTAAGTIAACPCYLVITPLYLLGAMWHSRAARQEHSPGRRAALRGSIQGGGAQHADLTLARARALSLALTLTPTRSLT